MDILSSFVHISMILVSVICLILTIYSLWVTWVKTENTVGVNIFWSFLILCFPLFGALSCLFWAYHDRRRPAR